MSSSRLAKLRNRAGAGNPPLPNRNMQQQQQQQQQQPRQQQKVAMLILCKFYNGTKQD